MPNELIRFVQVLNDSSMSIMNDTDGHSGGSPAKEKEWNINLSIPNSLMKRLVNATEDPEEFVIDLITRQLGGGIGKTTSTTGFNGFMKNIMQGEEAEVRDDFICIIQLLEAYRCHNIESNHNPSSRELFESRMDSQEIASKARDELNSTAPSSGRQRTIFEEEVGVEWRKWLRKAKLRSNKMLEKNGLPRFGKAYGIGEARKHPCDRDFLNLYCKWYDELRLGSLSGIEHLAERGTASSGPKVSEIKHARRSYRRLLNSTLVSVDSLDGSSILIDES